MSLTEAQFETLKKRELQNIATKLARGGTLTAREGRLLEAARTDADADKNFAEDYVELALILKKSRRTLQTWREKYKDYPDFPKPRADGRHDVAWWLKFMADHDLGVDGEETESEDPEDKPESFWKRKRARLDFERGTYSFEIEQKKHLPIDEITLAVGQKLAGCRTALNNLPGSAARWIIGLRDFHAIKNKLQTEVDAVLRALGRCDYLNEARVETIARSLPFDAATEDLLAKVNGQDRDALCELIARVALRSLAQFGREALGDLLQEDLPAGEISPQSDRDKSHVLHRSEKECTASASVEAPQEGRAPAAKAKTSRKRRTK